MMNFLARAIAASTIPIISAVGHEIDFTIADFVADLRAPTPSAAAELVAKSSVEIGHKVDSMHRVLVLSLQKILRSLKEKSFGLSKRLVDPQRRLQDLNLRNDDLLTRLELAIRRSFSDRQHEVEMLREKLGDPQDLIQERRKELDYLYLRSGKNMQVYLERRQAKLTSAISVLDSLSPLKVVERGYSIVTKNKEVIKSSSQLKIGDQIEVRLAKGSALAVVKEI